MQFDDIIHARWSIRTRKKAWLITYNIMGRNAESTFLTRAVYRNVNEKRVQRLEKSPKKLDASMAAVTQLKCQNATGAYNHMLQVYWPKPLKVGHNSLQPVFRSVPLLHNEQPMEAEVGVLPTEWKFIKTTTNDCELTIIKPSEAEGHSELREFKRLV